MSSIPYFDRTLDSFADETITKTQTRGVEDENGKGEH